MARPRPERSKSQWAELRAATEWYLDSCQARGIDREQAIESWEDRSIAARIRLFKASLRAGDDRAMLAQANQLSRKLRARANELSQELQVGATAAAAFAIVPGPHSGTEPPAPTRGADVDDARGMDEEPEPFDESTGPMPTPGRQRFPTPAEFSAQAARKAAEDAAAQAAAQVRPGGEAPLGLQQ